MTNLRVSELNTGDVLLLGDEPIEVKTVVVADKFHRSYIEYTHRRAGCTVCNDAIGGPTHHRIHNGSIRKWSSNAFLKRAEEDDDA